MFKKFNKINSNKNRIDNFLDKYIYIFIKREIYNNYIESIYNNNIKEIMLCTGIYLYRDKIESLVEDYVNNLPLFYLNLFSDSNDVIFEYTGMCSFDYVLNADRQTNFLRYYLSRNTHLDIETYIIDNNIKVEKYREFIRYLFLYFDETLFEEVEYLFSRREKFIRIGVSISLREILLRRIKNGILKVIYK